MTSNPQVMSSRSASCLASRLNGTSSIQQPTIEYGTPRVFRHSTCVDLAVCDPARHRRDVQHLWRQYGTHGAGTLSSSVPLIARKPNNAPTQRFLQEPAARTSYIHLYWSRTLMSFIGLRGFSETGLDEIPASTIRFLKECGNTAFLRDSEPPTLSMAKSIRPCFENDRAREVFLERI